MDLLAQLVELAHVIGPGLPDHRRLGVEFDERLRIIINDMIITGMMNSDPIPMVRALRNRMIINPIAAQTNSTTQTHIGGRDQARVTPDWAASPPPRAASAC